MKGATDCLHCRGELTLEEVASGSWPGDATDQGACPVCLLIFALWEERESWKETSTDHEAALQVLRDNVCEWIADATDQNRGESEAAKADDDTSLESRLQAWITEAKEQAVEDDVRDRQAERPEILRALAGVLTRELDPWQREAFAVELALDGHEFCADLSQVLKDAPTPAGDCWSSYQA